MHTLNSVAAERPTHSVRISQPVRMIDGASDLLIGQRALTRRRIRHEEAGNEKPIEPHRGGHAL